MDRKEFIKTCGLTCAGAMVFTTLLQSCAGTNYFARTSLENNKIIIRKTEFVLTQKNKTIQRKYVLLKTDKYHFPICVYKLNEENYSALLLECTHRGCELEPHTEYLSCPCHGSEFTNTGIVQHPPAEENLKTFIITTDNEHIYIQL